MKVLLNIIGIILTIIWRVATAPVHFLLSLSLAVALYVGLYAGIVGGILWTLTNL